jgi:hypothetical protein
MSSDQALCYTPEPGEKISAMRVAIYQAFRYRGYRINMRVIDGKIWLKLRIAPSTEGKEEDASEVVAPKHHSPS